MQWRTQDFSMVGVSKVTYAQRCPALCILDLSYNVKYRWSCRVGGCYGHLTASGS